jgi:choice-of-anchor B domain-containing protein
VYAFRRGSNGRFSYTTTLMSSDSAQSAGDAFGSSISMSGSTAIIGATGQANRAGVVHEFAVDASGMWSSVSSFAPVGLGDNDAFGSSVLLSGTDEAIVAAPGDAGGYGALYVLRKAPPGRGGRGGRGGGGRGGRGRGGANANWQEQARLTAPVGNTGDGFGSAIAAHDREVWAAAPGARGSGGVYVFSGNVPAGSFEGVNFLAPTGVPAGGGQAGASISVRGNVAAVGVPGATRDGGVIIYEWNGEWREQPIIIADVDEIDPLTGSERKCGPGGSVEMFECGSVELYSFLPPSKLTHDGHYIQMSDVWGWTDPQTGKDWALVGRRDGTTFIDISNPANPVSVADLPLTDGARPASWRDIKVYKDHAYIVADGAGPHGMQVVDLSRLRTMRPQSSGQPARIDADLLYRDINSAHNIVINEESGFAYSVGTSGGGDKTCGGGLHMIDIRTPKNPTFVGCFADTTTGRSGTGYSHDAVCINYNGPDTQYRGHEICVGSNENSISIADVTDKQNPKALARATYPRVAYAHQGWFTTDHRYFYLDDEADELAGVVGTRTMIYDVTDLDNPRLAKEHIGVSTTSDHNLYIVGNLMYQANYRSGLRVLDIRDPLNPKEIGFFDTAPYTQNAPGYNGAWSVYPFFKSGTILVTSIEQGIFMLKGPAIVF